MLANLFIDLAAIKAYSPEYAPEQGEKRMSTPKYGTLDITS
jgi:hypothetical protein